MQRPRLRFVGEVLGLSPLRTRLREARSAVMGLPDVPGSRFGLSSLAQFRPRIGPKLWAGRFVVPKKALVTNLFNHTQTPIEDGWSVRKTAVRDFRGGRLTYDSHNGTDFSIPVGTLVTTPAPGRVVRVASDYNRGGLKIFIDHGEGWMTATAHLARSLVRVGDRVCRGQPIAWSGYSGIDALITFPWGTPHIHLNVWLGGVPVDPFPFGEEVSLWHAGERPKPVEMSDEWAEESAYDMDAVDAAIARCRTPAVRRRLESVSPDWRRAADLIAERLYYPTRFSPGRSEYPDGAVRRGRLDLPFRPEDIDGMVFVDELGS